MNKPTIEALTWAATLTGAVISACSLAAGDAALPDSQLLLQGGAAELRMLSNRRTQAPHAVGVAPRRRHDAAQPRPRPAPSQQPGRRESWQAVPAHA